MCYTSDKSNLTYSYQKEVLMMNDKIQAFRQMIESSHNIVFFGGAGVSTSSGIPDFRSADGLFTAKTKFGCTPEEIVSHSFYKRHTEEFFDFVFSSMIFPDVKPNTTHLALAKLEHEGKLRAVVTQNIDGLHQAAGSKAVYELHGSFARAYCQSCKRAYGFNDFIDPTRRRPNSFIPRCDCGGVLKPDVVLYEEALNDDTVTGAIRAIQNADMLIVGGTSLVVYPAAGLLRYFRGKNLVLINRDTTPYDDQATLVIHDDLSDVFAQAVGVD